MSIRGWINADNSILVCDPKTGDPTPAKYSTYVQGELTYKYWDYLAWSIASLGIDSEILAIGYGAGTFLQLLQKWDIHTRGVGIELDSDLAKVGLNWLPSPCTLELIYGDFRKNIGNINSKFDLVMVDVYSAVGYVDDAYDIEWIKTFLSKRKSNGRIVFHCVDTVGSLIALGSSIPKLPSVLGTMLKRIRALTDDKIYIIPLWSSYLLWIGEPPFRIKTNKVSLEWLNRFLLARMIEIDLPEESSMVLPRPWTYTKISENDNVLLKRLEEIGGNSLVNLKSMTAIMGPVLNGSVEKRSIQSRIKEMNNTELFDTNKRHAQSFLSAMIKDWSEALDYLDDKIKFPGWV